MAYVIVTASDRYVASDDPAGEDEALLLMDQWAIRLDDMDGEVTDPGDPSRGGAIRRVRMEEPRYGAPARPLIARAYETAALLATRGQIGIAVGHGFADRSSAWVDLAPDGLLRIDAYFLEALWHHQELGSRAPRELFPEEQAFLDIGSQLQRRRVRRVDLYTCSVGASGEGRRVLDWMHHLWRVPVRGLRARLEVEGRPLYHGEPVRVRVLGYTGWVRDELLTNPGLWVASRATRPELQREPPTAAPSPSRREQAGP